MEKKIFSSGEGVCLFIWEEKKFSYWNEKNFSFIEKDVSINLYLLLGNLFFSAILWLNSEYKCSTCFQPHYFDMFYIDFVGCHSRRVRGWLAGRGLLYQGVVWRWTSKYYKILFRQLHWRGWSSIFIFC